MIRRAFLATVAAFAATGAWASEAIRFYKPGDHFYVRFLTEKMSPEIVDRCLEALERDARLPEGNREEIQAKMEEGPGALWVDPMILVRWSDRFDTDVMADVTTIEVLHYLPIKRWGRLV